MARVKQQEIADALNISKATVSRCFSNHPGISPDTRAQVFRAASELGYQPVIPKKGSARRDNIKARVAAVVCLPGGDLTPEGFSDPGSEILVGLSEIALLNKWSLETHLINPLEVDPGTALRDLVNVTRQEPWNGLFLLYRFPKEALALIANRIPCVSMLERYGDHLPIDGVDSDSRGGISLMVDRLVEKGHRRIGFYSELSPDSSPWVSPRFGAYVERLAIHGIRFDPEDVFNVYPDATNGDGDAAPGVIGQTRAGMSGLVCAADSHAYNLIARLREDGIEVPRDLSLTGFDGIETPEGMPKLSTVAVPYPEIGITAMRQMEMLLRLRSFASRQVQVECFERAGDTIAPCVR